MFPDPAASFRTSERTLAAASQPPFLALISPLIALSPTRTKEYFITVLFAIISIFLSLLKYSQLHFRGLENCIIDS